MRRCYNPMPRLLKNLLREEKAQDAVEYSLLLAFVVLCSAALFLHNQQAINGIWSVTSDNLESAKSAAS